jgi:hypothetical protein
MCSSAQAIAFSFWGRSRKIEPWFSIVKSGPIDSVGEVPEAAKMVAPKSKPLSHDPAVD